MTERGMVEYSPSKEGVEELQPEPYTEPNRLFYTRLYCNNIVWT